MPITLRHFHDLGQLAHHILGMEEEDRRAMRADARGAEDALALPLEPLPRRAQYPRLRNKGDAARPAGSSRENCGSKAVSPKGSINSICVPFIPESVGVLTKQTFTPCSGRSNGSTISSRAHRLAVKRDAVGDGGRRNTDVIEAA